MFTLSFFYFFLTLLFSPSLWSGPFYFQYKYVIVVPILKQALSLLSYLLFQLSSLCMICSHCLSKFILEPLQSGQASDWSSETDLCKMFMISSWLNFRTSTQFSSCCHLWHNLSHTLSCSLIVPGLPRLSPHSSATTLISLSSYPLKYPLPHSPPAVLCEDSTWSPFLLSLHLIV